jgi:hypothetical protein
MAEKVILLPPGPPGPSGPPGAAGATGPGVPDFSGVPEGRVLAVGPSGPAWSSVQFSGSGSDVDGGGADATFTGGVIDGGGA